MLHLENKNISTTFHPQKSPPVVSAIPRTQSSPDSRAQALAGARPGNRNRNHPGRQARSGHMLRDTDLSRATSFIFYTVLPA